MQCNYESVKGNNELYVVVNFFARQANIKIFHLIGNEFNRPMNRYMKIG